MVRLRILDKLVAFIAIAYPLTALPQLFEIWYYKNASGVSILTWSLFMLFTIPLILYSFKKKDHKLVLMWSLWLLVYVSVISGIIIYG